MIQNYLKDEIHKKVRAGFRPDCLRILLSKLQEARLRKEIEDNVFYDDLVEFDGVFIIRAEVDTPHVVVLKCL